MIEKLQALNETLFLEVLEKEEMVSPSGIIFTGGAVDEVMKNLRRGKIMSVGNAVKSDLKVGEVVVFSRYVGSEVGNQYIIVQEKDLLGVER